MNKRALLCVTLFSLSTVQIGAVQKRVADTHRTREEQKALVKKLYTSYVSSLVLSGAIGATTGAVVRYLEKKLNVEASPIALFLILLGWALESEFRHDVIVGLQKDLDSYDIEYKKGLMFKGAWIASWLAYLHA